MHLRSRWIRAAAGAVALLTAATSSAVAQAPTAEQLFAKHDAAIGGKAAFEKYTAYEQSGTFSIAVAGISGPVRTVKIRPGSMLISLSLGPMGEAVQGYDGTTAWAIQPGAGPSIVTGTQADEMKEQADFFSDLHDMSKYSSATNEGEVDWEGKKAWKVKIVTKAGKTNYEYFDTTSGLQVGSVTTAEGPMGLVETTQVIQEYKSFGGIQFATKFESRNPQFTIAFDMTEVKFEGIDPKATALPDAIKALIK